MKNKLGIILIIFLLLIIQVSFINNLFYTITPNILLVFVIYISQKVDRKSSVLFAFISGILYDIILSPNLGLRAFSFVIVALIINSISEYIFDENVKISVFYSVLGIIIYRMVLFIVYFFLSYKIDPLKFVNNIFHINTIISITIYLLYEKYKLEKVNFLKLVQSKRK